MLASELPGPAREAGFRCLADEEAFREDVARRARALGLQPLRWPSRSRSTARSRCARRLTPSSIGRAIPFAQAAFRQAFAAGHDSSRLDFVLIAAAACEMHPTAVLPGRRASVAER